MSEFEVPTSLVEAMVCLIEELSKISEKLSKEKDPLLINLMKYIQIFSQIKRMPSEPNNRQNLISLPETVESENINKKTIFIYAKIVSLGEIDTINEKFKAEVHVKSCWREPELDGTGFRRQIIYPNWLNYWKPELFVENGFPDTNETATYILKYDSKGRALVEERRTLKGTCAEILELYDFPFDCQELTVRLSSTRSCAELDIEAHPTIQSAIIVPGFRDRQQWKVSEEVVLRISNSKVPLVSFTCKVKRLSIYFWINVILIMFSIGLLTFCTFTISSKNIASRLTTSFFLLLALVTYRFGVNKMLPKIAYLTYLDKYMLSNFSFICVIPIWHAIVAQVIDSVLVEYVAMTVIGTAYLLFNLGFFVVSRLAKKKKVPTATLH